MSDTKQQHRHLSAPEIAQLAAVIIGEKSHYQVAKEVGIHRPRVWEAVNGERTSAAIQIIEHYSGEKVHVVYAIGPKAAELGDVDEWVQSSE